MRRVVASSVWLIVVIGGAAGTLLANGFLHLFPIGHSEALRGTLVATFDASKDTVALLDVGEGRAPVVITPQTPAASGSSATSTAGVERYLVQDFPYWDSGTHQFWLTASAYQGASVTFSEILTTDGRGQITGARYRSDNGEALQQPTTSPVASNIAVEADPPTGVVHLDVLDLRTDQTQSISIAAAPASWSSDGGRLAYSCFPRGGTASVCVYDLQDHSETVLHIAGFDDLLEPSFSPDGTEIVVAGTAGPGITKALLVVNSTTGATLWADRHVQSAASPVWSPDGDYVGYVGPQGIVICGAVDGTDCRLVMTGQYAGLQWVSDDLQGFGLP
jgi:hypothetical protein